MSTSPKVVHFPASPFLGPTEALSAAQHLNWQDVLIIGYDRDGQFMQRSSRMDRSQALWIIEWAKRCLYED